MSREWQAQRWAKWQGATGGAGGKLVASKFNNGGGKGVACQRRVNVASNGSNDKEPRRETDQKGLEDDAEKKLVGVKGEGRGIRSAKSS